MSLSGTVALAAVFLACGFSVAAGQDQRDLYRIDAVRVDEAPRLDGIVDESVWQVAEVMDAFVQQEPDEGAPGSERTEVRILYDAENVYFGIRAFDASPEAVTATEMRRDSERILEEDNIQIILDTFLDSRSGYMFVTNPLGAKLDQQVFNEGEGGRPGQVSSNINRDWDGIWHVEARRTSEGWSAEISIPVVSLRFPDRDVQRWGINVMRNIGRKNEQSYWAPIPKAYGITRVSMAGSLDDLQSLDRGTDLRVKPFVVGGAHRVSEGAVSEDSFQREIGVDVRYGVTASLNLDVTVNTDFAQAEVDDQQVNLTRFQLFFPEKREFFLENAGRFNVGSTASTNRYADLFFSRRIGLSNGGEAVPILGGARLTGSVGRNDIAIMDVQTEAAFGREAENFLVARYSRNVLDRSRVGAIFVNREETGGSRYNRTYGLDMLAAPVRDVTVSGFLARTATPGLDGDDMGAYVNATWLSSTGRIYAEHADLQENFNPEVGFVPRRGIRTTKVHLERNPRPGLLGIRVMSPMYNLTYTTDQAGRLVSRRHHYMVGTRFENGAYLNMWYNDHFEWLDVPFPLRSGVIVPEGSYRFGEWRFSFDSNPARRVYYGLSFAPQSFYDGDRTDYSASLGLRVNSRLSTEARYQRNEVDLDAGAFDVDLASVRIDVAVSPTMTLRTLTQYNSSTEQWGSSARFRWTYSPGSDLFIVFDEVRRDQVGLTEFRDRRLIIKLTHLLSG